MGKGFSVHKTCVINCYNCDLDGELSYWHLHHILLYLAIKNDVRELESVFYSVAPATKRPS